MNGGVSQFALSSVSESACREAALITEEILVGSEVLDRKRAEIKRVVHTLIGLLNGMRHLHPQSWVFQAADFEWWVHVFPSNSAISARYREGGVGSEIYNSSPTGLHGLHLELRHVARVREHLPILVHGMLKAFPLDVPIGIFRTAARSARINGG